MEGEKDMLTRIATVLTRRARIIIFVLACAIGIAAGIANVTLGIDNASQRLRDRIMAKKASGNTVVVGIDSRSIQELQAWPWPRSMHGELAEKLVAAGAKSVVFDVAFTTHAVDPVQDQKMAASLARTKGRVTLLAITDVNQGNKADVLPLPQLIKHASPGTGWIRIDDDTSISLPYSQVISGRRVGTLATALARMPVMPSRPNYLLDWSISYASIPEISYADVIKNRIDPAQVRGKDIIVGATAQTFGDQWSAADGFRIPGVYIHALGAETLKRQVPIPVGSLVSIIIASVVIGLSLLLRSRPLATAAIVIAWIALIAQAWLLQEHTGYVETIGPATIAMMAAIILQAIASTTSMVMKRITTDTATDLPNLMAMRIEQPEGRSLVAVRIHNHLQIATVLGNNAHADLLRRIRDRIRLVAGDDRIYQVDEHSFAWRTHLDGADLSDAIEGLGALFSTGIPIDGKIIDTPVNAGIVEDWKGLVDGEINAALLAAEHAARQGLPWTRHVDADDDAEWRLTMMGELETALKNDDVWVAYQPKWNIAAGRFTGAEALVRWTHPERGPIRPDKFIPLLEDAGRIEGLTRHVLEHAIRDFAELDGMSVAVNISARVLGKGIIVPMVDSTLQHYRMDPNRLTLEITESAILSGNDGIAELAALREQGIGISLDDYGTGQSTLTYLRKLPATELKIDQSFVRTMLTSRSDHLMIESTIGLSHQLGLKVVAEGVETQAELDALKALDCDIIQGYHLGRPVPLEDFVRHTATDKVEKRKRA